MPVVMHGSNAWWQQCMVLAVHAGSTLHSPLLPLGCIFRTLLCKTPSMLEGVQARSHSSGWNLPPRTPPDLSQFGLREQYWGPSCTQPGASRPPPRPPPSPPSPLPIRSALAGKACTELVGSDLYPALLWS